MAKNTISILDGSTFLVSDPRGDVEASPDETLEGIPGRWGSADAARTRLEEALA
jgi:hypothetical protein